MMKTAKAPPSDRAYRKVKHDETTIRKMIRLGVCVIMIASMSCKDKGVSPVTYLGSIPTDKYYSSEVIPLPNQQFYGKWKLDRIVGGIGGQGADADFDFLEVKPYGIYAIMKEGKVIESGSIKVDTFDSSRTDIFQVVFQPDILRKQYPTFPTETGYIQFRDEGMYIGQPCCDTFQRMFIKVYED